MTVSTPTRERIIDAAMQLFSERGYRGTSVAQIEATAGLAPGAGGLYHHFRTKEEVLSAGIERHLARLGALRDIRRLLTGLGDVRSELTMIARYTLAELDREGELLRILASEARSRPDLVRDAAEQLIDATYTEFISWIRAHASDQLTPQRAEAVAAVGLGALVASRILAVLGMTTARVDDQILVNTWADMMIALTGHYLESGSASRPS
jgi:AcrR family transcriptional regulator